MLAFWSNAAGALRKASISQLGGVTAADFLALQQDVAQNYLLDAINGAWAAGQYSNGGYDAFNSDTIGANSTNQTYDGTNKLYGNPGTPATSYANSGGSGNRTASITVTVDASLLVNNSPSALVDGDNTSNAGNSSSGVAVAGLQFKYDFGSGASKVITEAKWYQNAPQVHGTWKWQGSNDASAWTDIGSSFTLGDAVLATQTITALSANTAGWRYYRMLGVSGSMTTGTWFREMEFKIAASASPTNMTLVSSALSPAPASTPTQVKLMVLYKAIDTSTLNTDFTAEATRDGTTWTAGTLSDTGLTISGFKVLWAVVDVSAQPSGTTVKYRLKTLNAKSQQAKGIALMTK